MPLTRAFGNASLWAESSAGAGDFRPFDVEYGQIVRFYGNRCLHFTKDNDTDVSRVSLDFRVVRLCDFAQSGIKESAQKNDMKKGIDRGRWQLFGFYDIMGPNGVVRREDWDAILVRHANLQTRKPCEIFLPNGNQLDQADVARVPLRRQRSSSAEHIEQCAALQGSLRAARKNCARCSWLYNRASLRKQLVYTDASGANRPWIAENSDFESPWGLGCVICSTARRGGFGDSVRDRVPKSCLSEFTFGTGMQGLPCGQLFLHGNCAKRQSGVDQLLAYDEGHAAAITAAAATASASDA